LVSLVFRGHLTFAIFFNEKSLDNKEQDSNKKGCPGKAAFFIAMN
jgi:hypothetical protein